MLVLPEPLKLCTMFPNSAFSWMVKRDSAIDSLSSKLMMMTAFLLLRSCFAFVLMRVVFPVPKSDMKMTRFLESSFRIKNWAEVQKMFLSRLEIFSIFSSVYFRRSPENVLLSQSSNIFAKIHLHLNALVKTLSYINYWGKMTTLK